MLVTTNSPPTDIRELAKWFSEAVHIELEELENKKNEKCYELLSGRRNTDSSSPVSIYHFILADDALIPDDASGTLEIGLLKFPATILSQENDRLSVQIDSADGLDPFVPRALLRVDTLGLIRKLAESLDDIASNKSRSSHLMTAIFHPDHTGVSKVALPDHEALKIIAGEQRYVVEQACGSPITYVWGPPGTGKTYVIAHLITALIEIGQRVLMTSHTNAAVDQSIVAAAKPGGPLNGHHLFSDGKIVTLNRDPKPEVPESTRLNRIMENMSSDIQSEKNRLDCLSKPLLSSQVNLKDKLTKKQKRDELHQQLNNALKHVDHCSRILDQRTDEHKLAQTRIDECRSSLDMAGQAWFFRDSKIRTAKSALVSAEDTKRKAVAAVTESGEIYHNAKLKSETARLEVELQHEACGELPELRTILNELADIDRQLEEFQCQRVELQVKLDGLEQEVINNARLIAATLTKTYVGRQLKDQVFDSIIIDEISMASPPLLFLAARLGVKRVILVGDFKQLPPIVRSDNQTCRERLGTDAFHLAGIASDLKATNHPVLVRLSNQRRMLPAIANVARRISYDGPNDLIDDDEVKRRLQPRWLRYLPENPLIIVDTADLHCWSGKQAGSLSRFNLYSAQIAVELAAMAAIEVPMPTNNGERQIGIVTPYGAQKRLILKLLKGLELDAWVRAGTVHTFQGGEAELIIFDTVLDEPHWTARLTTPKSLSEVRRDLNVAVTRAKSKFVMIGSSEWLNKRAKETSGLGQLWHYMKDHAHLIPATDLIEKGFGSRVIQKQQSCYSIPMTSEREVQEVLDENTFFESFEQDLGRAEESVFGLVPFFGEYRWPRIEPHFRAALERGVKVTLLTPPAKEAENTEYVEKAIHGLRRLGAIVIASTGLHGKDIIIDERIHYTGSLNWASHRGRSEIMHRSENKDYAKLVLEYLQVKHIVASSPKGKSQRTCPICHGPLQVVSQTRPLRWEDRQPLKIGCAEYQTTGCKYLVNIDQRAPLLEPPTCNIDKTTKYRRVKRGKGERWECPKHPKQCKPEKVIAGDV